MWWIIYRAVGISPPFVPMLVSNVLSLVIQVDLLQLLNHSWPGDFQKLLRWINVLKSMYNVEIVWNCFFYFMSYLFILNTNYLFNIKTSLIIMTSGIQELKFKKLIYTPYMINHFLLVLEILGEFFSYIFSTGGSGIWTKNLYCVVYTPNMVNYVKYYQLRKIQIIFTSILRDNYWSCVDPWCCSVEYLHKNCNNTIVA